MALANMAFLSSLWNRGLLRPSGRLLSCRWNREMGRSRRVQSFRKNVSAVRQWKMMSGTSSAPPTVKRLVDYQPPEYRISHVDLTFELSPENTLVRSILSIEPNGELKESISSPNYLVLDADPDLRLVPGSLKLDGVSLQESEYESLPESLTIRRGLSGPVLLESQVHIDPVHNRALEGLYMSGGNFATQCEAEGFRRITFFLDRPDVMATYRTTIVASKEMYPVLLSNGNRVDGGAVNEETGIVIGDGSDSSDFHYAVFEDPFPKPSYLFALVAGNLVHLQDSFKTMSGREVSLRIYVRDGDLDRCPYAMESLKRAMKWDEDEYGREYDLDTFNIVAVNDFNMGAMENKSLNIFNSKYVLASRETATDSDFNGVESVIAHEYFHNWTGNRVTCRDWFQLSLKEGLTVFRDQEFSGDMGSSSVNRIKNVVRLRESQFPEDAGPMAHPVRPSSYMEINNFYTATVYQKGAEVIRMLRTLVGDEGFRKGTDLYFERNDGKAVTCDEWVRSIQLANPDVDFGNFMLWYSQAGTPEISVDVTRDGSSIHLNMRQKIPDTPDGVTKQPMLIPISVGLISSSGTKEFFGDGPSQHLELKRSSIGTTPVVKLEGDPVESETKVLRLTESSQSFSLSNVPEGCRVSLLREFSAPVKLNVTYEGLEETDEDLCLQMAEDQDEFNRWEAGQRLATRIMLRNVVALNESGHMAGPLPDVVLQAFQKTLRDDSIDDAIKAQVLTLPSERWVAGQLETSNPEIVHEARSWVKNQIGEYLANDLRKCAVLQPSEVSSFDLLPGSQGRRALRGIARGYLVGISNQETISECLEQVTEASNMTDALSAFSSLVLSGAPQRSDAITRFYEKWRGNYLVVDKWLRLQAMAPRKETLDEVRALVEHEAFQINNPNNVYAVLGGFGLGNPYGFHSRGQESYEFFSDLVVTIDKTNPQVSSRMVSAFNSWKKCDPQRQHLMLDQLQKIVASPGLSKAAYEIVSKALAK